MKTLSIAFAFVLLLSCTKNENSNSISGVAQAGRVKLAKVALYKIETTGLDSLVGSTTTNSTGEYSLVFALESGVYYRIYVGDAGDGLASYTDEATQSEVLMGTHAFSNIISAGSTTVPITPLTHIMATRVIGQLKGGGISYAQLGEAITAVKTEIAQLFGIPGAVVDAIPGTPEAPSSAQENSGRALFALAMLSQFLKDQGVTDPNAAMDALARDMADGKIDGSLGGQEDLPVYKATAQAWATGLNAARSNARANTALQGALGGFDDVALGFIPPTSVPDNLMAALALAAGGNMSCNPYGNQTCPAPCVNDPNGNVNPNDSCASWDVLKECLKQLCKNLGCPVSCEPVYTGEQVPCDGGAGSRPKGSWQCLIFVSPPMTTPAPAAVHE